jgi:hypothetical protein
MERGIERSFFDAEKVGRLCVNVGGEPVAVHGTFGVEGFEDEEDEGALKDVVFLTSHT